MNTDLQYCDYKTCEGYRGVITLHEVSLSAALKFHYVCPECLRRLAREVGGKDAWTKFSNHWKCDGASLRKVLREILKNEQEEA